MTTHRPNTPAADPLILLHPEDNVVIARRRIEAGGSVSIDGAPVTVRAAVDLGHKLARHDLAAGDTVIRYGAPIGSMTAAAARGEHVHLHNMKSDYIPSHGRDAVHVKESAR